jgi:hypothetical protein
MEGKESWGVLVGAELAMACGGVDLGHSFFQGGFHPTGFPPPARRFSIIFQFAMVQRRQGGGSMRKRRT